MASQRSISPLTYPPAPRSDDADVLHGITIADPFRTLENPEAPATQAWSKAQSVLIDEHRAHWTARERYHARLSDLLRAGVVGTPVWRGDQVFHVRRLPDQEHAVLLTIDPDGTERVLIDPVDIDATGTTTLDAWQPSKEGDLLAYQLSEGGSEESSVRVLDVATGEIVDGPLPRTRVSPIAWLPGGEAFYYVRRLPEESVPEGEAQYHRRVHLHRIGADPETDAEVFGAGRDKTNFYGVSASRDGRWLIISAAQGTSPRNDVWIADLSACALEQPELRPVVVGADARTSVHVGRNQMLYVSTDLHAARGRLAVTDPARPGPEHWRDLLPEDPDAVFDGFAVLDGPELRRSVLLAAHTRHAVAEVNAYDLESGRFLYEVGLPGLGSIGGLSERPEGGHEAWFAYTDHATPPMVLHYDATSFEIDTWATAPGAVDVPAVRSIQVSYRSADGTEVRMIIVAPADDHPLDDADPPSRPRPTVLYGYGGFDISLTPAYSATTLAWVESGGVWAVANLRGGSEEGEQWHRAGMRDQKQNVFDDFHAAAEYLVEQGWTTPDQLAVSGGSNGGLLVGAVLTQRPELYRAVVCSAPLLDMVRYEKFGLGQLWNDEYGTASDPDELRWLLGYSPYHHVRPGTRYPAVLFIVFDGDTRVDPLHARKMAAALQDASTGDAEARPILLRAEGEVGHGARAVSRSVDLGADQLGFLAAMLDPGQR